MLPAQKHTHTGYSLRSSTALNAFAEKQVLKNKQHLVHAPSDEPKTL